MKKHIFSKLITLIVVIFSIMSIPQSAYAHGIGGVQPSPTKSVITSISPPSKNFEIVPIENGERIKITRLSNSRITVLGVDSEQYIQLRTTGVYINKKSSTRVINLSTAIASQPDEIKTEFSHTSSDPKTPPIWQKVSTSNTYIWHDHRAHYMGNTPSNVHSLGTSEIQILDNSTIHTVTIEFLSSPSKYKYLSISLLFIILIILSVLAFLCPRIFQSIEKKIILFMLLIFVITMETIHILSYTYFIHQSLGAKLISVMYGLFFLFSAIICIGIVLFSQSKNQKNFFILHAPVITFTGFLGLAVGTLIEYKSLIEPYPASTLSPIATRIFVLSIGIASFLIALLGIRHIKESQRSSLPTSD